MKIVASYDVITPLMLGGANHAPEFRLPSYVHVLRWWWRFLALGRFESVASATYWEAVLFGWHSTGFGRKRISFRLLDLQESGHPQFWTNDQGLRSWSGISYLTAQGFSNRSPALVGRFTLEARLNARALPEDADDAANNWPLARDTLVDAMALIGLLGGLGARARRGFGSLSVSRLIADDETIIDGWPDSVKTYGETITKHLGPARYRGPPPYSALSDQFRCEICASDTDARKLMNDIGWAFQIFRSYGQRNYNNNPAAVHRHQKRSGGAPVSLNAGAAKSGWYHRKFQDDHDYFYARGPNGYGTFPDEHFDNRAVFGLPHNYGRKQVGWDHLLAGPGITHNRRASPLLFHFHRLSDGDIAFVLCIARAKFAPDDARLSVGNDLREAQDFGPLNIDFILLDAFAAFLRHPDATGAGCGVSHTTFTVQNVTVKKVTVAP